MGKREAMEGFLGCFTCTRSMRSRSRSRSSQYETPVQSKAIGSSKISDYEFCGSLQDEKIELKRFSWEEIVKMTSDFSEVIGVGGFSTVYLGRFPGSGFGAVKVYNGSERLKMVFRGEVEITSQLCHSNIVSLLGYCDERDEGVLVFEYMPHGDLQEKLHNKAISQVLPWKTRMIIAFQLAQALENLHERRSPHIVHGDIKSSNILLSLDESSVSCKLCDFGFAKTGFSSSIKPHSSSSSSSSRIAMMGSPGYIDPHYLMTGLASKKSDIYSFGVVLLELITGLEAFCLDPRLGTGFNVKEARAMACIAAMCLHHLPSLRPSATEICQAMKENISNTNMGMVISDIGIWMPNEPFKSIKAI